ncbi:MAG: adenine phosphoribosyltransferase [Candidatus Woesearchaeota archaeon]
MHIYEKYIESFIGFPKEGVIFWDFTPLLENPQIFKQAIADIKNHYSSKNITKIAAIESKGFVIGSALALEISKPLCLIRKPNLIPGKTISRKFEKEYGFGEYTIKKNAFKKGDKVLIVYDIFAGPGATMAAIELVEESGAEVVGCTFVIELLYLGGTENLSRYDLFSLVKIQEKKLK